MVGIGEFEQFDGCAVFDYKRDAGLLGNQDFAASKLGGKISHFKRDVRNLPDEIGDRRVHFETHWKLRSGMRRKDSPLSFPAILGRDVSGIVRAVGANVKHFKAGDRVLALSNATYAE
jgi:hypothetical protein